MVKFAVDEICIKSIFNMYRLLHSVIHTYTAVFLDIIPELSLFEIGELHQLLSIIGFYIF